jgi:hypothetical protein
MPVMNVKQAPSIGTGRNPAVSVTTPRPALIFVGLRGCGTSRLLCCATCRETLANHVWIGGQTMDDPYCIGPKVVRGRQILRVTHHSYLRKRANMPKRPAPE